MLYYKIDVLAELKKCGYNSTVLHDQGFISQSAIQSLRENKIVGAKTINSLCGMLNMQPGDIIGYSSEGEEIPMPPIKETAAVRGALFTEEQKKVIRRIVEEIPENR